MKLTRIVIDGVALIAAALVVPGITLAWDADATKTLVTLLVLAFVFGIINAYVRPVLRAVSLPVNLLSMGAFSFLLNAGLLLLLAWLVDKLCHVGKLQDPVLTIGGFPPTFSVETLGAAVAGSLVITIVSTLMSVLVPDA